MARRFITRYQAKRARRALPFNRHTAVEQLERHDLLAFGLTTSTNLYTVDTGAGLVFSVARTTANSAAVGDLTSTIFDSTQLEASHSVTARYSHYESGLGGHCAPLAGNLIIAQS
ncbi:MAG TPA: rhamnogalacturonan lyase B N-terminal domain-containing protein [Pirellulales bacterium]|nr:rhamnogalacturonan lyase B N-terminal domain-containing protein [Pirellulales bacterium]